MAPRGRTVKCVGVLKVDSYSESGDPAVLVFVTPKGDEFELVENELWLDLTAHADEELWISGSILPSEEDDDEAPRLEVRDYRSLGGLDDDEDDYDEERSFRRPRRGDWDD